MVDCKKNNLEGMSVAEMVMAVETLTGKTGKIRGVPIMSMVRDEKAALTEFMERIEPDIKTDR